jgi:murein tripeptide amidase MpaA
MPVSPEEFAVYTTYNELQDKLQALKAEHPGLMKLESAGKTTGGRDLWLATITNFATSSDEAKPAMYIDGNHHAGEVTGCATCLYTIAYLLGNYGKDESVTSLLDTRAFYILPRVSPDGAELYLTTPYMLRSTPRLWPLDRVDDGIVPEDMDGDGRILNMRFPDPDGDFKVSSKDPRLMVRRRPDETGGEYYRVYTEGLVKGYDGAEIRQSVTLWGLDLNRNYPVSWGGEAKQPGSGLYPLSEPETRSVAAFFSSKRNIAAAMSYHTTGGVILRPRCTASDLDIPQTDLVMYRALGRTGTEITGYPCKSIFEGFTMDKRRPSVGSLLDLSYDHLGVISFATELWNLRERAGVPDREPSQMAHLSEAEEEEDGLKLLHWLDTEMAGEGFSPWKRVSHPQLGEVETGGIDPKFIRQNPPPKLLPQECHKNMMFTLAVARATPIVRLDSAVAQDLGGGMHHITAVVSNSGYMPSSGTAQAVATKVARPVEVTLALPEGGKIVSGKEVQDAGHLSGRAQDAGHLSATGFRKKLSWLVDLSGVQGEKTASIKVDGMRGGKAEATLAL